VAWRFAPSNPALAKHLLTGGPQAFPMQIQKRTMGWLPKASLYNEQAAKRAKQRASHQAFMSSQTNLTSTIGNIMNTNMTETTNIVSKIALARLEKKA
jgi:hypothetical protein